MIGFGRGQTLEKIHTIIFESETRAGRLFDIVLLIFIVLSIVVVMLESIDSIAHEYPNLLLFSEIFFTVFFSIEYILRIISSKRPWSYIRSYYGIVDLLSILPAYLGVFIMSGNTILTLRALRLLRIFRILKMAQFLVEGDSLLLALKNSRRKITIFLMFVLMATTFLGSLMYLVEGQADSGFTSIPRSIYWAIVTLTTVGYGDIAPVTNLGQFITAFIMILGYAVLAVPSGIFGAEIIHEQYLKDHGQVNEVCPYCNIEGHAPRAIYCDNCGNLLHE